jgi:DNA-binding transcriptional ArsR family regulator
MKRPMDRGLRAQAAAIEAARIISTNCLAIRTRRLHRSVSRVYDAALRPHGLTAPQLALLVAIALTRGVQPKILSPILDLEKSTLSRNLALLVKHGWIQANRSGRSQTVRLTAERSTSMGARAACSPAAAVSGTGRHSAPATRIQGRGGHAPTGSRRSHTSKGATCTRRPRAPLKGLVAVEKTRWA